MNGPAFRHALRASVRTAIVLAVGLGAFFYLVMLSSSSFAANAPTIPFFQNPPRAITAFVGGEADFLRPSGWLSTSMLHPIVLALQTLGAFVVTTGTGATEMERGTLDLVLARPVGRRRYLTAKIAAAVVVMTIVHAGGVAGVLIARETVAGADALRLGDVLYAFAGEWLLFFAFSMAALWIFSRSSLRSRALGAAVGLVVVAFFVNFVSLLFDATEFLGLLTPFHYYSAPDIVNGRTFWTGFFVLGLMSLAMTVLAYRAFSTRDLA